MRQLGVLFVCLGNICRSPTAQGVMERKLADAGLSARVRVDSAGTAAYHLGKSPDSRSSEVAAARGYRLDHLRARRVSREDFETFDYVLALDRQNLEDLQRLAPEEAPGRPQLLLDFAGGGAIDEVPDPYYGGPKGFERVLDLIEAGCTGLLSEIRRRLDE